ncbi:hypothetical protein ACJX0J_010879 [Zea mays]
MHVCIYVYLPGTVVVFQISCFSFNDFDKDISFLYEFTTHEIAFFLLYSAYIIEQGNVDHVPKSCISGHDIALIFFSALQARIKIGDLGLEDLLDKYDIYEIVGMDYWHEHQKLLNKLDIKNTIFFNKHIRLVNDMFQ